jgi:hypothetical protein
VSVAVSVCMSVWGSDCLSVCLSVCLFVWVGGWIVVCVCICLLYPPSQSISCTSFLSLSSFSILFHSSTYNASICSHFLYHPELQHYATPSKDMRRFVDAGLSRLHAPSILATADPQLKILKMSLNSVVQQIREECGERADFLEGLIGHVFEITDIYGMFLSNSVGYKYQPEYHTKPNQAVSLLTEVDRFYTSAPYGGTRGTTGSASPAPSHSRPLQQQQPQSQLRQQQQQQLQQQQLQQQQLQQQQQQQQSSCSSFGLEPNDIKRSVKIFITDSEDGPSSASAASSSFSSSSSSAAAAPRESAHHMLQRQRRERAERLRGLRNAEAERKEQARKTPKNVWFYDEEEKREEEEEEQKEQQEQGREQVQGRELARGESPAARERGSAAKALAALPADSAFAHGDSVAENDSADTDEDEHEPEFAEEEGGKGGKGGEGGEGAPRPRGRPARCSVAPDGRGRARAHRAHTDRTRDCAAQRRLPGRRQHTGDAAGRHVQTAAAGEQGAAQLAPPDCAHRRAEAASQAAQERARPDLDPISGWGYGTRSEARVRALGGAHGVGPAGSAAHVT